MALKLAFTNTKLINTKDDVSQGWKESDHPRAKNGQFGANGAAAIQNETTAPKKGTKKYDQWSLAAELVHLGLPVTNAEYKKLADKKGVEVPSGGLSTILKQYKAYHEKKEGAAPAPEPEAKKDQPNPDQPKLINNSKTAENLVSGAGLKKEGTYNGVDYYFDTNNKISYKPGAVKGTGTWKDLSTGKSGETMEGLQEYLNNLPKDKNLTPTQQKAANDPYSTVSAKKYGSAIPASDFKYTKHGIPSTGGFSHGIQGSLNKYTG